MKYDNIHSVEWSNRLRRVALSEMKTFVLLVAASTLGGCAIYSDGRIASAFDEGAIKAELARSDKEFGNR